MNIIKEKVFHPIKLHVEITNEIELTLLRKLFFFDTSIPALMVEEGFIKQDETDHMARLMHMFGIALRE